MPFTPTTIVLEEVGPESPYRFRISHPLSYLRPSDSEVYAIPRLPFETDLASVPRTLTWLIPRYGVYTKAAVLHDAMCREPAAGTSDRFEADEVFREGMRDLDVPKVRIWLMWGAVTWATASMKLLMKVRCVKWPVPRPETVASGVALGGTLFRLNRRGWLKLLAHGPAWRLLASWYAFIALLAGWVLATVAGITRSRRIAVKMAGCWSITVPALPLLSGGVVVGVLLLPYTLVERVFRGGARSVPRADPSLRSERVDSGIGNPEFE